MTGKDRRGEARRRARGELEAEVLAALWAADRPVTAAVVQESVSGAAYTTVLTILTRLCEKGLVSRRREGRGHAYAPVDDRAGVAAAGMHSLLDEGGDRAAVLARFVSDLSTEDERLLKQLLHGELGQETALWRMSASSVGADSIGQCPVAR